MTRELLEQLFPQMCPRVRGFWHGIRFQMSATAKDHLDPEFCRGWFEGLDLLFDERRAEAEAKDRQ